MWLSAWSSDITAVINGTQDISKRNMYLSVYAALGLGQGKFQFKIYLICNYVLGKPTMNIIVLKYWI